MASGLGQVSMLKSCWTFSAERSVEWLRANKKRWARSGIQLGRHDHPFALAYSVLPLNETCPRPDPDFLKLCLQRDSEPHFARWSCL